MTIFSIHVAQLEYDPLTCKQEKSEWILVLSDRVGVGGTLGSRLGTTAIENPSWTPGSHDYYPGCSSINGPGQE